MRQPRETVEARALVRWVRMEHGHELLIAHVPNETPTTPDHAAKMKSMGVSTGFPDYVVVHRSTHKVVFVELKKRKGGKHSDEQKIWIAALGSRAAFCHGWHEAAEFIARKLLCHTDKRR